MSVAECQRRVSSKEFARWIALAQIEPWHDTEFRAASIVASTIHNAFQIFIAKGKRQFKEPADFMPAWEESSFPTAFVEADNDAVPEAPEMTEAEALFAKSSWVFMKIAAQNTRKKPN